MKRSFDSYLGRTLACLSGAALTMGLAGCGDRAAEREPLTPSTEVTAVDTPKPAYPMELACAGIGGEATLTITVGVDGKPSSVRLVKSSGNDDLDQIAIDGVKGWQFKPATRNGQPHAQPIQVPVNFKVPQVRPDECFALEARD